MTLIVIEGVDGSGKSTVAQHLPHTQHVHCGPIKQSPWEEYVLPLAEYDFNVDMVCDRLHVGELIYGPIYRGESKLDAAARRFIEMFLDSRGALKVIIAPPLEVVSQRLVERGEDFLQASDLERVWNFYRLYGSEHGWLVVERPDVAFLRSLAEATEARARHLASYPQYVGHATPDTLLVAPKTPARVFTTELDGIHRAPFKVLNDHPDSAANLLFRSLPQDERIGVADTDKIGDLWEMLGYPRLVALGSSVSQTLNRSGIPCKSWIPHPYEVVSKATPMIPKYADIIMKGITRA